MRDKSNTHSTADFESGETGFTLIEVVIALVLLFIVVMGVFAGITYSTRYNTGNSRRSQALAVFQQEIELLRSAKFTPTIVSPELAGGTTSKTVDVPNNGIYLVETTVDDDTFTAGDQVNAASTLKEIRILVTPQGTDGLWVNGRRAEMVLRRVRAN